MRTEKRHRRRRRRRTNNEANAEKQPDEDHNHLLNVNKRRKFITHKGRTFTHDTSAVRVLFPVLILLIFEQIIVGAQVFQGGRAARNKELFSSNGASLTNSSEVIDQDYEVGVADQLVSADNDAIFRCQLTQKARQLYQVIGWLEEDSVNQQQITHTTNSHAQLWSQFRSPNLQRGVTSSSSNALVLPDGQLLVQHAQLRDSNKAYRCQLRNQLSSLITVSPLSGRLFVTENNEQNSGPRAPRIIEGPKPITVAKAGEQLLLTCIAQAASQRPTIRWFRQAPGSNSEWIELNSSNQQQQQQEFVLSQESNFLLLKSPQLTSDQRAKFKCLANNSFGVHFLETELKLEQAQNSLFESIASSNKVIELEPKVELISESAQLEAYSQTLMFNCSIKLHHQQQPLLALEWLKNGKKLFSIVLTKNSMATPTYLNNPQPAGLLFQDPNQELTLIEYDHLPNGDTQNDLTSSQQQQQQQQQQRPMADVDSLDAAPLDSTNNDLEQQLGATAVGALTAQANQPPPNYIATQTTLNKLLAQQTPEADTPADESEGRGRRIGQKLKLLQVFNSNGNPLSPNQHQVLLLYQLQLNQVRRSDRGAYQCRARFPRKTLQVTGELVLKDNPPQFIETFSSQLITTKQAQQQLLESSVIPVNQQQQQQQQHNTPTVSISGQVSLKCVASGSPLPEISWSLSGFPLPDSSRFRVGDYVTRDGLIVSFVHISQIQVEDGGLYECGATNDVGQLRHSAWLNVTGPPHVRSMPNVSAVAGSSLSIMCPVGGWPIEQIVWFQNSSKLPLNHRQKLFNNGTLIINELNEVTDSGQYYCQARGPSSDIAALNHVHISIKVPPVLEPFSFAKSLHRGQRYNIMCTVVRGDLPVDIRWLKDGRPLEQALLEQQQQHQQDRAVSPNEENGGIAVKHLDPYSSTLTFASLQAKHRGLYTCEATNEAGKANQSSALVIHIPPEWRIEPHDLSVTVGKTAVIDCQADGSPSARIEWRLSQDLFREPPNEFKPIISSLYMRVFENGSLIIYNTQRTDAGYYLCQANNGVGAGLSRVIKLTVNVAAHFKSKIRTELVRRGQAAKLKCEAIGDLPVEINWLRDKMPLYAADEPRYSLSRTQLTDGIVSELNIIETDRIDSALFTCLTQNQFGNDDTNIQLIVQAPPDPPLDIRIHEYEARSVKISWLAGHSGNSPITKYVIMYAQTGGGGGGGTSNQQESVLTVGNTPPLQYVNASVSGNETSLLLSGLTPLTEYQFFMFALNAIGSSRALTEPIKFRTDDEAPSGPPMFVKAQALSSRSIKVRWRAPERRAHFGSIAGFYVGYKLHRTNPVVGTTLPADTFIYKTVEFNYATPFSGSNDPVSANKTLPQTNLQLDQECTLVGLKRGQKYLITVQAFNSRGAGPASEPVVIETWRIDVPEAPILRMVQRTARSIHLAWRIPAAATFASPTITSTTANNQQQQQPQQQQALIVRKNINDHIRNHQFSAAARVGVSNEPDNSESSNEGVSFVNEDSDSGDSGISSDSMVGEASPLVSSTLVEDEGAESREFAEAQANEPILGFVLIRKQLSNNINNNNEQLEAVETRLPSDHLSQIVDQLTCGTRYQFTVAALNSVGVSQPSEALIAKTEGSTPVAPDKSSLLWVNASSSVIINLSAWHNGACAMRSFDIMFKASRSKKWSPLTNYQISSWTLRWEQAAADSRGGFSTPSGGTGNQSSSSSSSQQQQQKLSGSNQLVQRSTIEQQQSTQTAAQVLPNSTILLEDLSSALNYDLKIVATNEAGSTEALYTFNTNPANSQLRQMDQVENFNNQLESSFGQFSEAALAELFTSASPLLPFILLLLFVLLALSAACLLIARRRHASSSNCSLSLSSASRSNQSSSNYYTSERQLRAATNGTSSAQLLPKSVTQTQSDRYAPVSSLNSARCPSLEQFSSGAQTTSGTLMRKVQSNTNSGVNSSTLNHNHHHHQQQQQKSTEESRGGAHLQAHLAEQLYSAAAAAAAVAAQNAHQQQEQQHQQLELADKSNYAYLSSAGPQHPAPPPSCSLRTSSPHNTDLASLINGANGSEAEMCLGASALNLNVDSEQQQVNNNKQQQQQQQQQTYYMSPELLHQHQVKSSPNQLGKSSTLPGHCQQQILQQLIQQQQLELNEPNQQQQQQQTVIDSLMAANMIRQQQQCNPSDYSIQQVVGNQNQVGVAGEANMTAAMLLEQQLQQQVYATVKRGCPRPPRPLCGDYTIYQCPNQANQQQQSNEQMTIMRCCAPPTNANPQEQHLCYHNQNEQQDLCNLQQQQQQASDYQQLRPIN